MCYACIITHRLRVDCDSNVGFWLVGVECLGIDIDEVQCSRIPLSNTKMYTPQKPTVQILAVDLQDLDQITKQFRP